MITQEGGESDSILGQIKASGIRNRVRQVSCEESVAMGRFVTGNIQRGRQDTSCMFGFCGR